jgi:hypothetical protein
MQCIDAKVMKRAQNIQPISVITPIPVIAPAPSPIPSPMPAPMMKIDQDAIKKRLDEQLRSPIESAWNDRVNDLFDLAMVNRELARDYFIKMREKMLELGVKPVELVERSSVKPVEEKTEEPMKRATGPGKPAAPKIEPTEVPKTETTESIPSGEAMTISTKKAPPRRFGQKPVEVPKTEIGKDVAVGKEMKQETKAKTPVKTEQIFSKPKLKELDNDKLLELFKGLLNELGTVLSNWNGMFVEKVEEKTKYGSKIYNVYGAPVSDWTRKIDTLRDVLSDKNIMTKEESKRQKEDRIAQVRAEKAAAKPVVQPEEKRTEEITEADVVRDIKELLAKPADSRDARWETAMQANIRRLKPLNPAEAEKYRDQLNKLMKNKK